MSSTRPSVDAATPRPRTGASSPPVPPEEGCIETTSQPELTTIARTSEPADDPPAPCHPEMSTACLPSPSSPAAQAEGRIAEETNLPETFWSAHDRLAHIRQAAHARGRSADAVLHAVLARVAACIPYTVKLPPVVGSAKPLTQLAMLMGPSGTGKTDAATIAKEILPPTPDDDVVEVLLGSGEGIVESLFARVQVPDPNDAGKVVWKKVQKYHNAFVYVDEGEVLADLGKRAGSTLLPTVRSIFSGAQLGQSNASGERRRVVPAGQYSFGIVVALQDELAGPLLADVGGGTPQRFCWASALDPSVPDEQPVWPGPLQWDPPTPESLLQMEGTGPFHLLSVAGAVANEIQRHDRERMQGNGHLDPLDAHGDLIRLKMAGLLALLFEGVAITEEIWHLAGVVKTSSDGVRRHVQAVLADRAREHEDQRAQLLARREVKKVEVTEAYRVVQAAVKIATLVQRHGDDGARPGVLRRECRHYRDVFDDGLEHALGQGWVQEHVEEGRGTAKRSFTPGRNRRWLRLHDSAQQTLAKSS